jgi:cytochrome oxidase Cu insertion factor (SCO1/SenC/PrrC family)
MKIFNRGNISYFITPIIILIFILFAFTLLFNKANASQNIKINSDFELVDQNNKKVTKANFLGSPTVLFFGFTYCPDVCPTTLQSLSVLIDKLGKDKDKLKFYFVSVDPERDTPDVLKDYLSSFNPKINALTGKQKDLDVLIKSFSIYAKKVPLDQIITLWIIVPL